MSTSPASVCMRIVVLSVIAGTVATPGSGNSGPGAAIRMLQRSVGTTEDGVLGPITLTAAGSMHPARLVSRLSAHRLLLMADLPTWPAFGRGWARRVARNLLEAS